MDDQPDHELESLTKITQTKELDKIPDLGSIDFGTEANEESGFPTDEVPQKTDESKKGKVLEEIKDFSEKSPLGHPIVEAEYPFSLLITGALTEDEKTKLKETIIDQNLGIPPSDLAVQFEENRILIPRISEYAGILIIQLLRNTKAKILFSPSDNKEDSDRDHSQEIDSDLESESSIGDLLPISYGEEVSFTESAEDRTPANQIPLLVAAKPPEDVGPWKIIDSVTASGTLRTPLVEAQDSPEYENLVESLQKQLKYLAYARGANVVVNFTITLTPLSNPSVHRMTAIGTAIYVQHLNLEAL